ncbi:hypothetical protein DCCM_2633 [Desulfocucumis palustris]|uniref:Uncharacterized protein n=1 Tax=Desulfocucumis palustris TaxID=1898651 RepID=A0A2L2XI17_9FIRM|nr:hypothetical protein DCCM_2633 [Desulfocucumis palustris]
MQLTFNDNICTLAVFIKVDFFTMCGNSLDEYSTTILTVYPRLKLFRPPN